MTSDSDGDLKQTNKQTSARYDRNQREEDQGLFLKWWSEKK